MRIVFPDDWNGTFEAAPEVANLRRRAEVVIHRVRPADLQGALRGADVAVAVRERTPYDADLLGGLADLKLIVSVGGRDNPSIDKEVAMSRGTLVCFTSGALGQRDTPQGGGGGNPSMVELTIGMMISAMREFAEQDRAMRAGEWPGPRGKVLHGKTLGIVSLGRLGSQVARAAQFFGMRVLAAGLTLTPERAAQAGVEFRTLDELFAESDVISIHLKLADRTRGLIDGSLLRRMKPGALLVNTSRGPLVNDAHLVEVLQQGRIGAALDVYDQEPLPPDHPLRHTPHTLLLAHCGWPTDAAYEQMIPETVRVIEAFLDGAPINVENPSVDQPAGSAGAASGTNSRV